MTRRARTLWTMVLGGLLLGGCDSTVEPIEGAEEGVSFTYSGRTQGTFVSEGTASPGTIGTPQMEAFAMAQRDSIGGLLLGSFHSTGENRGDLFILQLRNDEPGSYSCGAVGEGPHCYGHLYLGVDAEAPASAEQVYTVSGGRVQLTSVSASRLKGTFDITLTELGGGSGTVVIEDGTLDVPLVQGVFDASFRCLTVRLAEGPQAPCE